MSWYGSKPVQVDLGGAFHSRRLKLVSSQVGMVSPGRRAALGLPAAPRPRHCVCWPSLALDALVTEEIAFEDAPERLPQIFAARRARSCPSYPLPTTPDTPGDSYVRR